MLTCQKPLINNMAGRLTLLQISETTRASSPFFMLNRTISHHYEFLKNRVIAQLVSVGIDKEHIYRVEKISLFKTIFTDFEPENGGTSF